MNIKRGLAALATSSIILGVVAMPASAKSSDSELPSVPAPKLLTDTRIDWVKGSSEWVNLLWTSEADISNVEVTVISKSKGLEVEYPTNQDGFTSLSVDRSLAKSEIDHTSVKLTTDPTSNGTKQALVYVSWTYEGRTHEMYSGRLQLTNKTYKGADFAIMTEDAVVSSDAAEADENWIEFNYKGLAPRTNSMKMTVESDLEVYHPQTSFTSLHHDETLRSGETDVARIWLDPELLESGARNITVNITYTDYNGKAKTEKHVVKLKIK